MSDSGVRLTETVQKGGCAAKLPAGQLRRVLESLQLKAGPELSVGAENFDDAALWDLGDGRFLVQTLDFFTPILDDPFDFGGVAAANALSDVYAMGGEPKIALTILAFPSRTLEESILLQVMKGAVKKLNEAGVSLAGGHSIDDDTLKFGFSVTGFVKKESAWKNSGARPGDVILLTKALGTGTLATALKAKQCQSHWLRTATDSMLLLNRAPELLEGLRVTAATDITGFGLAGHAWQMARASQVSLDFDTKQLPILPGAIECLNDKLVNRAHRTNQEYVGSYVDYGKELSEALRLLTVDPQTSGGLLIAVCEEDAGLAEARLRERFPQTRRIGKVKSSDPQRAAVTFK